MSNLRLHYNRLIENEIRQTERFLEQAEKRGIQSNIDRFHQKIIQLRDELKTEDSPKFLQYEKEQEELARIHTKNSENKTIHHENKENRDRLQAYYKDENKSRRMERHQQYHIKREWEWLCRQDAMLPDYIRNNLQTMPNNRGYIWKDIWYFGAQPIPQHETNIITMSERNYKGDMFIHEICPKKYHRIIQTSSRRR